MKPIDPGPLMLGQDISGPPEKSWFLLTVVDQLLQARESGHVSQEILRPTSSSH